jgi:hypothetical protein
VRDQASDLTHRCRIDREALQVHSHAPDRLVHPSLVAFDVSRVETIQCFGSVFC